MTTTRIVHLPSRGLRCRALNCQAEIILATTLKRRQMPVDRHPIPLQELDPDQERAAFVPVQGALEADPELVVLLGLTAARRLGYEPREVYLAHWATCRDPDRFRRR